MGAMVAMTGGCQRVVFDTAPATVANAGCDPALVGSWQSVDSDGKPDGELRLQVDAQCQVSGHWRQQETERAVPASTLGHGEIGWHRYLWVDSGWANRSFEVEATAIDEPAGVYLFRYQVRGRRLELRGPDAADFAQRILSDQAEGDIEKRGHDLRVRVRGQAEQIAKLLGKAHFADEEHALHLQREQDVSP